MTGFLNSATTSRMISIDSDSRRRKWTGRRRIPASILVGLSRFVELVSISLNDMVKDSHVDFLNPAFSVGWRQSVSLNDCQVSVSDLNTMKSTTRRFYLRFLPFW